MQSESSMKVLFLGEAPEKSQPWLGDFLACAEGVCAVMLYDPDRPLDEQFAGVDVVVDLCRGGDTPEVVDSARAAGVRLWQVISTGLDKVNVEYILSQGLTMAYTPGRLSAIALAEHALYLMLHFAKEHPRNQRNIHEGTWFQPICSELCGRTLGLVGFGASARELARRAGPLGMRLMAIDVAPAVPEVEREFGLDFRGGPDDLDKILAGSDYVSIHVPLDKRTRGLIDARAFEKMKPSAILLNIARGPIVVEAALIDALRAGKIRGAGLDVFEREPTPPDHPLLKMENVLATPHIAGTTHGTSRRRAEAIVENIRRVGRGEPPLYQVTSAGPS